MNLLLRATVVGALGVGAYQLFRPGRGRPKAEQAGDPASSARDAAEAADEDLSERNPVVPAEPTNEFERRLAAADHEDTPDREAFAAALEQLIDGARRRGEDSIDVSGAQLRRLVGGFAGDADGLPTARSVLRSRLKPGDRIVKEPKTGAGAAFTVRYQLGGTH